MEPVSTFNFSNIIGNNKVYFYINENASISLSYMFSNQNNLVNFSFNDKYMNNFIINDISGMLSSCINLKYVTINLSEGKNLTNI